MVSPAGPEGPGDELGPTAPAKPSLQNQAPWLDTYLHELTSFPNAKHDDQVDSTVFALAWSTPQGNAEGWIKYLQTANEEESQNRLRQPKMFSVWIPPSIGTLQLITGRKVCVPDDRIVEMSEEEFLPLVNSGAKKLN
jgi:hypothetical protein